MYLGKAGNNDLTQALTQTQAEVSSLLLIAMCVARIIPWVMNDQNILDIDTCNNDNNYDIDAHTHRHIASS